MEKRFFITGATGLLGSRMAFNLSASGYKIICLSRKLGEDSAEKRIRERISFWSDKSLSLYKNNIEVVEGDIETERLGLDNKTISRIGKFSPIVIHSAACTSFDSRDTDSLFKTNLEGTRNAIETAKLISARQFNHISTAYVAGNCNNIFSESDFDVQQSFKNAYEESKFDAEKIVREFSKKEGIQTLIFRPSIIMGDSSSGKTFNFNAIYTYLRVINAVAARANKSETDEIRFECSGKTVKNIIPADYAAYSIVKIILSENDESLKTYHITNPKPPSFSKLNNTIHNLLSIKPLKLVDSVSGSNWNPSRIEMLLKNSMKSYHPYLFHEPLFASMRTLSLLEEKGVFFPELDDAYFSAVVNYFLKKNAPSELPSESPKNNLIKLFEIKMLTSVGTEIIPNLKSLTKEFILHINSTDTSYCIGVEKGKLIKFEINSPQKSSFRFSTSSNVFTKLLLSEIRPQEAFFKKLVQIDGSVIDALSLSTVFEQFFTLFSKEINESQMV